MLRTTPGTHQLTSSMITSPFSSSRKMEIVFSRINSSFSFSDTFPIYKILILSPSFKLGTRSLDILFVLTDLINKVKDWINVRRIFAIIVSGCKSCNSHRKHHYNCQHETNYFFHRKLLSRVGHKAIDFSRTVVRWKQRA